MKKTFAFWLLICSFSLSYSQKITPFFTSAPDEIIGAISQNQRKDLVDYYQAGKTATITNTLNGKSQLVKLSDDFVALKTSSAGSLEIKMLPINDTTYIFATIHTVCGEMCDSRISFYNSSWKPLPTAQFFNWDSISPKGNNTTPVYTRFSLSAESSDLLIEQHSERISPDQKTDSTRLSAYKQTWAEGRFRVK